MSELRIYTAEDARLQNVFTEFKDIADALGKSSVRFEQWDASLSLPPGSSQEQILAAYRRDVKRLVNESGYQSVDVVSMTPDHPQRESLRAKFLDEHTHGEDEIRFFVEGRGLFYLHSGELVYGVLCEKNDLIGVPAGIPHWFDMGAQPRFTAIRLFGNPDGWIAHFTGSTIATYFPHLDG